MSSKCEHKELEVVRIVRGTMTFMCPVCRLHEDHDGMYITKHGNCIHTMCRPCAEKHNSLRICDKPNTTAPILMRRICTGMNTECSWCGVRKKRTHILASHIDLDEGENCTHAFCLGCANKLGYGHHDLCDLCVKFKVAVER